jgi:hypothetical protein
MTLAPTRQVEGRRHLLPESQRRRAPLLRDPAEELRRTFRDEILQSGLQRHRISEPEWQVFERYNLQGETSAATRITGRLHFNRCSIARIASPIAHGRPANRTVRV